MIEECIYCNDRGFDYGTCSECVGNGCYLCNNGETPVYCEECNFMGCKKTLEEAYNEIEEIIAEVCMPAWPWDERDYS